MNGIRFGWAALGALLIAAPVALGQSFGDPFHFTEQGGAAIYAGICAGCHMPDGRGATGAATYPALAQDARLQAAGYPIAIVLHGQKAMPGFARSLSDQQIADVVGFLRTHFGNAYPDMPSAADVKAERN
jgi:mono/diheme cytochrome c family protein